MNPRAATPPRIDCVVAAVLAVSAQLELWWPSYPFTVDPGLGHKPALSGAELGIALAVAFRRVAPAATVAVVAGLFASEQLASPTPDTVSCLVALLLSVGTAAALGAGRGRLLALGAASLAVAAAGARDPGDTGFIAILVGGAWLAGRTVRAGRLAVVAAETERDERARAAALEERFRIARELHDLVAHHISGIVLQAGAARSVVDSDPARAAAAMRVVEESGREALDEMRRLLQVLRSDEGSAERSPQPRLAAVGALAERLRTSGIEVDLRTVGEPRPLPAGVDLAAFRIVQEALTNAARHGTPSRIDVAVRYLSEAVEVEVCDDGGGGGGGGGEEGGAGHGLAGMRERVALCGGELVAGRENGGYRVRARLPTVSA